MNTPASTTPFPAFRVYDATVTARQQLSLGTRPAGTAPLRTHRHIPGSVLRGALAAVWIAAHGTPDRLHTSHPHLYDRFTELFEGAVRYEPLYAPGWEAVPMSVLRCKYPRDEACATWVEDEAFPTRGDDRCPSCGVPGRRSKGTVESVHASESARDLVGQKVRLQLDDATGTAEHGLLFTREAIRPRTGDGVPRTFTGRVVVPAGLSPDALAWLTGPARHRIHLGGRRGTGGGADLALTPAATGTPTVTGRRLALRLTAPALFTDSSGLPLTVPDTGELAELLGVPVTLVRSWTRHEHVGGWHAAANLPKPVELAAGAGSTYLLEAAESPDPRRVAALADRGLGLRRAEGFGALTVATTVWRPPDTPKDPGGAPSGFTDDDRVRAAARALAETGHGWWFVNELRAYVTARGQGAERSAALLDRPHLADLTPGQRRTVEAVLMRPDHELPLLRRIVVHLEAHVRAGRAGLGGTADEGDSGATAPAGDDR
jgi:CRISPR-associated protein Csx10